MTERALKEETMEQNEKQARQKELVLEWEKQKEERLREEQERKDEAMRPIEQEKVRISNNNYY